MGTTSLGTKKEDGQMERMITEIASATADLIKNHTQFQLHILTTSLPGLTSSKAKSLQQAIVPDIVIRAVSKSPLNHFRAVGRITTLPSNTVARRLRAEETKQWVKIVDLAASIFAYAAEVWVDWCFRWGHVSNILIRGKRWETY